MFYVTMLVSDGLKVKRGTISLMTITAMATGVGSDAKGQRFRSAASLMSVIDELLLRILSTYTSFVCINITICLVIHSNEYL